MSIRYRALSATGDYTFGHGSANFLVDSAAAVAQFVLTRLKLSQGEWFLDVTEGTPWATQVLGTGTRSLYDLAIQQRVLTTPGKLVTSMTNYSSSRDPTTRKLTVDMTIDTPFGATQVQATL